MPHAILAPPSDYQVTTRQSLTHQKSEAQMLSAEFLVRAIPKKQTVGAEMPILFYYSFAVANIFPFTIAAIATPSDWCFDVCKRDASHDKPLFQAWCLRGQRHALRERWGLWQSVYLVALHNASLCVTLRVCISCWSFLWVYGSHTGLPRASWWQVPACSEVNLLGRGIFDLPRGKIAKSLEIHRALPKPLNGTIGQLDVASFGFLCVTSLHVESQHTNVGTWRNLGRLEVLRERLLRRTLLVCSGGLVLSELELGAGISWDQLDPIGSTQLAWLDNWLDMETR